MTLDVLRFFFDDIWHFIGLCIVLLFVTDIVQAARKGKP